MLIVDRIEGDRAVCEAERGYSVIPLSDCEAGVKEGDVLFEVPGGYRIDPEETGRRRKENARLSEELFE